MASQLYLLFRNFLAPPVASLPPSPKITTAISFRNILPAGIVLKVTPVITVLSSVLFATLFVVLFAVFVVVTVFSINAPITNAAPGNRLQMAMSGQHKGDEYTTNELFAAYLERSSFRHKVLSENMANVNTPGYKADEVPEARDHEELMGDKGSIQKVRMLKTSRMHLQGQEKGSSKFTKEKLKDPYEIKPNGNNVSIAQQMTKLSQNQQDYNASVKGYATMNALVSAVLGK